MEPSPSPHIRGDIRILNRKGSFLTEDLAPQKGRRSLGVPGGTLRGRSTFHGESPRRRAPAGVGAAAWPPGPAHAHPESTVLSVWWG